MYNHTIGPRRGYENAILRILDTIYKVSEKVKWDFYPTKKAAQESQLKNVSTTKQREHKKARIKSINTL